MQKKTKKAELMNFSVPLLADGSLPSSSLHYEDDLIRNYV